VWRNGEARCADIFLPIAHIRRGTLALTRPTGLRVEYVQQNNIKDEAKMAVNSYESLNDLNAIISDDIREGVTLEYKGSSIFVDRKIGAICKTMTALANSAGGHFIIGIESDAGKPSRLDGGVPGPSKLDWIHKIINAKTFPALESVEVLEIQDGAGSYYVISTPPSIHAPHQSDDRRYYKRRGPHSEPMEHYEIEDVRNRPKQLLAPLQIAWITEDQVVFLHFKNNSESDAIKNLKCRVESNVEFERNGINSLSKRGLRELRPRVERYFLLDSVTTMLMKNSEAELRVHVSYDFRETAINDSASLYLTDLMDSGILEPPEIRALRAIGDKIHKLSSNIGQIRRDTEKIAHIADGSGLRLSQRTIRALNNVEQLFDPYEFDWEGYKILLEISNEDAIALYQIFGVVDSPQGKRARYEQLSPELHAKFEKVFRVEFC